MRPDLLCTTLDYAIVSADLLTDTALRTRRRWRPRRLGPRPSTVVVLDMGKAQSKSQVGLYRKRDGPEGECFLVNAHFNPLAVSDYEEEEAAPTTAVVHVPPPKTKKEADDSEIMLSVRSCTTNIEQHSPKVGFADDTYPLQVLLPPEVSSDSSDCIKKAIGKSDLDTSGDSDDDVKSGRVQGFECDVSVRAAKEGTEKQEFLFTLYDLDGHGKITKDDLAGLVRSIYEAMGSSLEHQPSGGKTIKVRLTVSPESAKPKEVIEDEEVVVENKASNVGDGRVDDVEERDSVVEGDVGVASYVEEHCNNGRTRTEQTTSEPPVASAYRHHPIHFTPKPAAAMHFQRGTSKETNGGGGISLVHKRRLLDMIQAKLEKNSVGGVDPARKRLSEYCNEKRRHRRQTEHHLRSRDVECRERRNHYLDLAGVENFALKLEGDKVHAPCRTKAEEENDDDDGEVEDEVEEEGDYVRFPYRAVNHVYACAKTAASRVQPHLNHHHEKQQQQHHHSASCHQRSRSHDTAADILHLRPSVSYHYLSEDSENGELADFAKRLSEKADWLRSCGPPRDLHSGFYHARSKSYDAYCYDPTPMFLSSAPRNGLNAAELFKSEDPNFSNRSPHHRKHRHREREYQRAMQQVASWLENEHIGGTDRTAPVHAAHKNDDKWRSHYHNHRHRHQHQTTPPPPPPQPTTDAADKTPPLVVERHEHHHIHEHFHHHYHHYHEL